MISKTFIAATKTIGAAFVIILIAGCGLPETVSLPKPSQVTSGSSYVVSFITPSDTTEILGYTIYYKVYFNETDFLDEDDDDVWFDEGTYINSNDEMQPGPIIPNQRGYIRFGEDGGDSTFYQSYQIANPGDATTVYIDFDPTNTGIFNNDSAMPIVHLGPIGPPTPVSQNTLVRGIIDPSDSNLAQRTFVDNVKNPSNTGDWDYDLSDGDTFYDADLRRNHDISSTSSVSSLSEALMAGEPFAGFSPGDLIIGVVVHSYGVDPVNLEILYSKPVYLGRVVYSPLFDTNRTTTNSAHPLRNP